MNYPLLLIGLILLLPAVWSAIKVKEKGTKTTLTMNIDVPSVLLTVSAMLILFSLLK